MLDFDTQPVYDIEDGGSSATFTPFPSSGLSSSNITHNVIVPSATTIIDRDMRMRYSFEIKINGASSAPGVGIIQAPGLPHAPGVLKGTQYYDAPRCFPLQNAISNIKLQIGGNSVSATPNQYNRVLQRFRRSNDEMKLNFSTTPSFPDQAQSYDDTVGYNRHPLSGLFDSDDIDHRGGFQQCLITRNDSTGAPGDVGIIQCTFVESIEVSPMAWARGDDPKGFVGLTSFVISVVLGGRGASALSGLPAALWSHAPAGAVLTSMTATCTAAEVLVHFITPDETAKAPPNNIYSYYNPQLVASEAKGPLAAGASTTMNLPSTQTGGIANLMYLYGAAQDSDFTVSSTDTFLRINSITVNYNNRSGLMADMSPQDLYRMNVQNGANFSYNDTEKIGHPLCIKFGKDIPLKTLEAPGLNGQQQISIQVNVTNISAAAISPVLYGLFYYEGVMTIESNNKVSFYTSLLSPDDVFASKSMKPVPTNYSGKNVYGGGWLQNLGNFVGRLVRPAITAAQSLVPAAYQPIVSAVDSVAKSYGYGKQMMQRRLGPPSGGARLTNGQLALM
jgi:hypothetical protein